MEEWNIGVMLPPPLVVMTVFCNIPSFQYSTILPAEYPIAIPGSVVCRALLAHTPGARLYEIQVFCGV